MQASMLRALKGGFASAAPRGARAVSTAKGAGPVRGSRGVAGTTVTSHQDAMVPPAVKMPPPRWRESAWSPASEVLDTDPALIDTLGRRHRYLRVSLTDRCNLRCKYCMPDEGDDFDSNSNGELLTSTEIHRLVSLLVKMGVRKVRLTGGEPTIRSDFGRIVEDLGEVSRSVPEGLSMGITTNGIRLKKFIPQLRAAGLTNINLSLDTLVSAKFPLLARRSVEWHMRVVDVLHEVAKQDDFKLKVNCVLLKGVNDDEIGQFIDLTEHLPIEVRFLEFMPFDRNGWSANKLVPQADIIAAVQRHAEKRGRVALRLPPDSPNDVARIWRVDGWQGRLGVIASMTDAFCGGCNRIRLTSDGQLRNCLFGEDGWSLRDAMREGADDRAIAGLIADGVHSKFAKLGGKRDMHELRARGALNLPMVALGG